MPTPLPPFRPRLIGLDLDGTILDNGVLRPDMLDALQACRAAGIELAFLTGRRPRATREALADYLDRAAICTNSGCLLWDYPEWTSVCDARTFPCELLEGVVDALAPWSLNLYHECGPDEAGRIFLLREGTPEFDRNRELWGQESAAVSSATQIETVLDGRRIMQVALPCSRELANELAVKMTERFGADLLVLVVRWPLVPCHALELYHPDAHKGSALQHFARRHGVAQSEVMAAGDDTNDVAMLRWAGWGVAMPHAEQDVRDAAQAVLEGDDSQAALAEYLRRIVGSRS